VDVGATFESYTEPSKLMEPRDGSLNNPSQHAQPAAVLDSALGDQGRDAATEQLEAMRVRIVSAVGDQKVGFAARATGFPADGWDGVDQGNELRDVIRVRSGEYHRERNPVSVGYQVMLAPRFRSIRGIRTDFRPPKTALTELESATARHQSILSASLSFARINSWIFCQTPAFCQSRRYRQQLIPEPQPSSWGSISHGMPLLSTKTMPVSAFRRSIGLRPGYLCRRSLGGGSIGSIRSHNSSEISSLAMCVLHKMMDSTLNLLKSPRSFALYVRSS